MPALAKGMLQPSLDGGNGCCLDDAAEAVSAPAVGAEHHSGKPGFFLLGLARAPSAYSNQCRPPPMLV